MLAEALDADALLILTDVPNVLRGYGTPDAEPVLRATPASLQREDLASASRGSKVGPPVASSRSPATWP